MELRFEGRVAAITGGASGIGRAAAVHLKQAGASVVILDHDEVALSSTANELGVTPMLLDVTDRIAAERAVDEVEATVGPISVLVTAAGVLDPPRPPERASDRVWQHVFAVNVDGTRIACELVGRRMAERGRGSIVLVASIAGLEPGPLLVYGPAKAAVMALAKSLAGAWGRSGVRVNAVAPGYVRTAGLEPGLVLGWVDEATLAESTALGRLTTAEEVASAIAFLCSDAAGAITGAVLPVDAGHLLAGGWAPHGGFTRGD